MASYRERAVFAEIDPNQASYIAKMKIRYIVEKELDGVWVAMARLPDGANHDQMRALGFAMGGSVRVEDLKTHEYPFADTFE